MKTFWTNLVSFFKKVWSVIAGIATWISSVLEDQGTTGSISSKRVTLGVALYMLWNMVQGMLAGKAIDNTVLYVVTGVILTCLGTISADFFSAWGPNGFNRTNLPPKV